MAINNGVGRIGIRSYVAVPTQVTASTLLTSLYSVWNADTTGTSLDSNIYGVWNGDSTNNETVKNTWNANGNFIDSKSGANGTIATPSGTTFTTGTMSFGTGKLGSGAFSFSGSNFISLPVNTLKFTGDFSVSCWIYVPTSFGTNYSRILSAFDNSAGWNTYRGWDISYSNGTIGFYIYPGLGTDYYGISVPMTLKDQWVHVSLSKVLGQQGNIYINGVAGTKTVDQRGTGSSTQAISYNTNNLSYIGSSYFAFSQPYYTPTVSGGFKIDSIQTWDIALNQTALMELYNGGNGQEYSFTVSNALIGSPKDSISTNHGTLVNGTTFTTGKVGQAFSFDGVNDYVELPSSSLRLTGDFTISCWFYMNTQSAYNAFVENFYAINISNRYGWALYYQSGKIRFGTYNLSTAITQGSTTISTGQWYHLVVTKTITGNPKIYINGVLESSTAVNSPTTLHPSYNTNNIPRFGVDVDSGGWGGYLNGKLDAVTTWTKEISPDEVVQLYNAGNGTQYPFSSQTLPSSANQLGVDNGTLMNGCTFTDGKIGKAFTFDGINDFVLLPTNSMRFTGDFSFSFFVSLGSVSGEQVIFACENYLSNENGDRGYSIYSNNGVLKFGGWYNNSILFNSSSTTTMSANTWYHFVVIKTASQVKIYMNGSLQTTTNFTGTLAYNSVVYPAIGVMYKQNNVNNANYSYISAGSKIDALSAWSKALTQAEITELYNSGNGKQLTATSIVTNGLILNLDASRTSSYPNTGTTWTDISGNGYNGTLYNGAIFGTANDGYISFDGVNDYATTSTTTGLNVTNITISSWARVKGVGSEGSYSPILSRYHDTTNYNGWEIYMTSDRKWNFGGRENSSTYLPLKTDTVYSYNVWYNVTCVKSGSNWSIYINGVLEKTLSLGLGNVSFGSNTLNIGAGKSPWWNDYGFSDISQVMIYNRALTTTEITQNFNATKSRFGL
jgi:hypothetical protein